MVLVFSGLAMGCVKVTGSEPLKNTWNYLFLELPGKSKSTVAYEKAEVDQPRLFNVLRIGQAKLSKPYPGYGGPDPNGGLGVVKSATAKPAWLKNNKSARCAWSSPGTKGLSPK